MDNPSPAVWLGVVGPVLALTAAIVGKISYEKGKAAGSAPAASDAVLERQEGAFQERVNTMLQRLGETITAGNRQLVESISAGNAMHRDELRDVSGSLRDSATAMRLVVAEVERHSAQTEPAIDAMLPLVRRLDRHLVPKRRRGRST